jgi:hypothetical protein
VTLAGKKLPSVDLSVDVDIVGNVTSGRFTASKGLSYSAKSKFIDLIVSEVGRMHTDEMNRYKLWPLGRLFPWR